jgi:hypothetical protein
MRFFAPGIVATLVASAAAASPATAAPVTISGPLTVIHLDDFAGRRSEILLFVTDEATGQRHRLQFGQPPRGEVRAGRTVTLRGEIEDGRFVVQPGYEYALESEPSVFGSATAAGSLEADSPVSGDQRTLVMLANFKDSTLKCSAQSVRDVMFTDSTNRSIDDYYRATSDGAVSLSGDLVGPYTLNVSAPQSCDIEPWADALDAAAKAQGVDPANYPRRVYVLPKPSVCPAGAGTVGDTPSRAWVFACDLPDVYAHELGHNLGMGHAGTTSGPYGDTSDIMGLSGAGLRELNAPHAEQMGWKGAGASRLLTESGTYDIAPLPSSATEAVTQQILSIEKPGSTERYYLSYRTRIGFDTGLYSDYADRVSVHRGTPGAAQTTFLAALADGQSFTDSTNGIAVTLVGRTAQYATVQVSIAGSSGCTRSAPLLGIAPSQQSAAAGQPVSYTVTLSNADSAGCGSSSFAFSAQGLPTGWNGTTSPASVSVPAGGSASATLTVTSSASAATGAYSIGARASDATVAVHAAAASATLNITAACVRRAPTLSLSPASQGTSAGTRLTYTGALRNNDDATCGARSLANGVFLPAGWSGSVTPSSVSLSGGQSASLSVPVTSPVSAAPGTYTVTVQAQESGSVVVSSVAQYSVLAASDTQAPTAPTQLSASVDAKRKRVTLSWVASTDNVDVTGYRIWRDGALLGESTGTWFVDGGLTVGPTYGYHVKAVDAAGNQSAASSTVSVSLAKPTGGKR